MTPLAMGKETPATKRKVAKMLSDLEWAIGCLRETAVLDVVDIEEMARRVTEALVSIKRDREAS